MDRMAWTIKKVYLADLFAVLQTKKVGKKICLGGSKMKWHRLMNKHMFVFGIN